MDPVDELTLAAKLTDNGANPDAASSAQYFMSYQMPVAQVTLNVNGKSVSFLFNSFSVAQNLKRTKASGSGGVDRICE